MIARAFHFIASLAVVAGCVATVSILAALVAQPRFY